jgi:hypothetical protein
MRGAGEGRGTGGWKWEAVKAVGEQQPRGGQADRLGLAGRGDPPVQRHEGGETWVHIGNPDQEARASLSLPGSFR